MTGALLAWMAALVVAAVGMRRPARGMAGPRGGASPSPMLGRLAAVPLPQAVVRFGERPGTADLIRAAGEADRISAEAVARARVCAAAAGALLAVGAGLLVPGAMLLTPVLLAGGFIAPGRMLAVRARRRRGAVVRELPDLLDLLSISVEAGMAVDPALDLAAARLPGVLGHEIEATRRELVLGTPRREAYAALAERTGVPEVRQVVAALLQAEELGAPLARTLAGLSGALRAARRQAARDRAARAAPRIQLVVAMVMVPAALLLVMGVLVIELARELGAVL